MERYTIAQRTKIVEIYLKTRSIVLTQRAYRRFYNVRLAPSQNTIYLTIRNFEKRGTVEDAKPTGRPRTTRSEENIKRVKESIAKDPKASIRWHATQLQIPRRTLQRILTKDIEVTQTSAEIEERLPPEQMTMAALAEALRKNKAARLAQEKQNTS